MLYKIYSSTFDSDPETWTEHPKFTGQKSHTTKVSPPLSTADRKRDEKARLEKLRAEREATARRNRAADEACQAKEPKEEKATKGRSKGKGKREEKAKWKREENPKARKSSASNFHRDIDVNSKAAPGPNSAYQERSHAQSEARSSKPIPFPDHVVYTT